jgi:hypothetical protein
VRKLLLLMTMTAAEKTCLRKDGSAATSGPCLTAEEM